MALSDDILRKTNEFIGRVDRQIERANQFTGENFIVNARSTNTYTDRTSNLRNSIGYSVVKDGVINLQDQGDGVGGAKANELLKEASSSLNDHALVMVAGMNYGLYVESKGYDVISNSVDKARTQHKRLMHALLKAIAK